MDVTFNITSDELVNFLRVNITFLAVTNLEETNLVENFFRIAKKIKRLAGFQENLKSLHTALQPQTQNFLTLGTHFLSISL